MLLVLLLDIVRLGLELLDLLLQCLNLFLVVHLDFLLVHLSLLQLLVEVFSYQGHLLLETGHISSTLFNLFLETETLLLEFLFQSLLSLLLFLQLIVVLLLHDLLLLEDFALGLAELPLQSLQLLFDLDLRLRQLLVVDELFHVLLALGFKLMGLGGKLLSLRVDLLVQTHNLGLQLVDLLSELSLLGLLLLG